jgi:nucleotide-binding universal stress UspA family protein
MNANLDPARIVVGIDGSPASRAALGWAMHEATLRGAPLHIVHAWRPMYATHADQLGYADAGPTSHAHGDLLLSAALGRVRVSAPHLTVSGQLIKGRPSAVLIEEAVGARMLVVGSRGLGGFRGLLLGSVGLHVVAHAPCSVVVVRSKEWTKGPVLVGVDGSAESKAVLAAAFAEASLRQSSLLVIWALYVHSKAEGVPDFDRALAAAKADAHETLRQLLTDSSEAFPDVEVRASLPAGYPAEVLANASATARMLIVGSHGGGGFSGMRLGSIAHAVVERAHCPVMVVRETVSHP